MTRPPYRIFTALWALGSILWIDGATIHALRGSHLTAALYLLTGLVYAAVARLLYLRGRTG